MDNALHGLDGSAVDIPHLHLLNYRPDVRTDKVVHDFFWNCVREDTRKRHSLIVGPVGSGKTTAMVCKPLWECLYRVPMKWDAKLGWFKDYKGYYVRESYVQAHETIIPTFEELIQYYPPSMIQKLSGEDPKRWSLTFKYPSVESNFKELVNVRLEYVFYAIGQKAAEDAWKSLAATDLYWNECLSPISQADYEFGAGRTGRYPNILNKRDANFKGRIFVDTNMRDEEHWLMKRYLSDGRPNHIHYLQPAGIVKNIDTGEWVENPNAENLNNLPTNYYMDQLEETSDPMEVRMKLANEPGYSRDGKAVLDGVYNEEWHSSKVSLKHFSEAPLHIYADAGAYGACAIFQLTPTGQWWLIDELYAEHEGGFNFGEKLYELLRQKYPNIPIASAKADLAGGAIGHDREEKSWIQHFSEGSGIKFRPMGTNILSVRLEALRGVFKMRMLDGDTNEPMLLINRECRKVREAFRSKYQYQRIKPDEDMFYDEPRKNHPWSDIADAVGYFAYDQGFGKKLLRKDGAKHKPTSVPGHSSSVKAPGRVVGGGKSKHRPVSMSGTRRRR